MTTTAAKRSSAVGIGLGAVYPFPDGTIDSADRASAVWVYFPAGTGTNTPITAAAIAIGLVVVVADVTFTGLGPIATGSPTTLRGVGIGIAQVAIGVTTRRSGVGKVLATAAAGSTSRVLNVGKRLAATAVGVAALQFGRAFFKTFAAVAIGVANMVKVFNPAPIFTVSKNTLVGLLRGVGKIGKGM